MKLLTEVQSMVKMDANRRTCLLLDVSFSMNDIYDHETGQTGIDALIDVAQKFKESRTFLFANKIKETPVTTLQRDRYIVGASTNMTLAFEAIREKGVKFVVLVTDGLPDDQETALQAAEGLVLDIIYVGRGRMPEFLSSLAKITGGQSSLISFKEKQRLIHTISGFLGGPGPKKKTIEL